MVIMGAIREGRELGAILLVVKLGSKIKHLHSVTPLQDLVFVACDFESLAAFAVPNNGHIGQFDLGIGHLDNHGGQVVLGV